MGVRRFLVTFITLLLAGAVAHGALADMAITVVSVTSPVKVGRPARVEIRVMAGAVCSIEVIFKSGPSRAPELRPRRADAQGRVVWLWRIRKGTPRGTWPIYIDCLLGENTGEIITKFTVR